MMLQLTESFHDLLPNADVAHLRATINQLMANTIKTVAKTLENGRFALAFSGGIDSSILERMCRDFPGRQALLAIGRKSSSDLATILSDHEEYNGLLMKEIETSEIELAAKKVCPIVSVVNLAHFEDCVSFWLIAEKALQIGGIEYILSANGPDELFCGYDRFRRMVDSEGYQTARTEIESALESADRLGREIAKVVSTLGFGVKVPLLEQGDKEFCLGIPIEYKILIGNDLLRKRIWRCLGRSLGLAEKTVLRRKKAMQYGMGIHAVVGRMLKRGTLTLEYL
jgi:asparagine synthase (glutamine-hydrolysing)